MVLILIFNVNAHPWIYAVGQRAVKVRGRNGFILVILFKFLFTKLILIYSNGLPRSNGFLRGKGQGWLSIPLEPAIVLLQIYSLPSETTKIKQLY